MTDEQTKRLKNAVAEFTITQGGYTNWSPTEVDKLEGHDLSKFDDVVKDCRFFYKRDPIASTVINKMVEIGITNIIVDQGTLSDNEYRVFTGVADEIQAFIEKCALEYLVSGFLVPEIKYNRVGKEKLARMGVKKYNSLSLPEDMWVRNPLTIKIKSTMVLDKPSYFIKIPDELVFFITNKGQYPDGTTDYELYNYLVNNYPEFIVAVKNGNREIPYTNDLIVRKNVLSDSPNPVPYLYPALETLKHKRNLRRMDYALAARAISAVQQVKLGSDEFPILEDDEKAFDDLRSQMAWKNSAGRDIERIFQLFTNHTVSIEWVYPPLEALLDDTKYFEVNRDIFYALGFPKILTTGETEKTQTSDPALATVSPVKTMEKMQRDLLPIVRSIIYEIATRNNFKDTPEVRFEKISLYSVDQLLNITKSLYEGGNLSRETLDKTFGYNFEEEVAKRSDEEKKMEELGVPAFAPKPFSPQPNVPGGENPQNQVTDKKPVKEKPTEKKPANNENNVK